MKRAVGLNHFTQVAIYAKPHTGMPLVRLNVNVAGTIARSLREECVEHANDGGIVAGF